MINAGAWAPSCGPQRMLRLLHCALQSAVDAGASYMYISAQASALLFHTDQPHNTVLSGQPHAFPTLAGLNMLNPLTAVLMIMPGIWGCQ